MVCAYIYFNKTMADSVCYRCQQMFSFEQLHEFESKGLHKRLINKSQTCKCVAYYVVCPKCVPDPQTWLTTDDFELQRDWKVDSKPPLLYTGHGKCRECFRN